MIADIQKAEIKFAVRVGGETAKCIFDHVAGDNGD